MKSTPEGTVFKVPRVTGKPALGVVARRQPRGPGIAAYFFAEVPEGFDEVTLQDLPAPTAAIRRAIVHDENLRNGRWPVLGVSQSFHRKDWPFNRVLHVDAFTGETSVMHLDDRNPIMIAMITRDFDPEEDGTLPKEQLLAPRDTFEELLEAIDR